MRMVDCWTWLVMPSLVHFLDFSKVYNLVAGMSMMNMVVCLYRRYRTLHGPVPWCSPRNTSQRERERELESRPHRTLPYGETDWLSSVHVDTYILHAPYLCVHKFWMCWYIMVMIYYVLYIYILLYTSAMTFTLPHVHSFGWSFVSWPRNIAIPSASSWKSQVRTGKRFGSWSGEQHARAIYP